MINTQKYVDKIYATITGHGHLAVISVGEDGPSQAYVRSKKRACEKVGFGFSHYQFKATDNPDDVLRQIFILNGDNDVTGIILQLPTPWGEDIEKRLIDAIASWKDVDGLGTYSQYKPCTPEGIMQLLEGELNGLEGKVVGVVGRGRLVGKPLREMLDKANATVISCNSHTSQEDICSLSCCCDAMVFATGQPRWISAYRLSAVAKLIDCGCFKVNGHIQGEITDKTECTMCTPDLGGVGPLTVAMLIKHCERK